jgi:DNA polymerase (family 10)
MNWKQAVQLALKIETALEPYVEAMEIAGSIRRGRPEVNDIDLVVLPRPGQVEALKSRCAENCRVVTNGPQNCIYAIRLAPGQEFQLDVFIARPPVKDLLQTIPGNFVSLLLCRTGSKEHNIWLVEHAKRIGLTWKPYAGVFDEEGYCLASETEEDIFRVLQLDFIPPEKRER